MPSHQNAWPSWPGWCTCLVEFFKARNGHLFFVPWLLIPELPNSGYIVNYNVVLSVYRWVSHHFATTFIFQITSSKLCQGAFNSNINPWTNPGPELEPVLLPSVVSRGVHRKSLGFQHATSVRWMSIGIQTYQNIRAFLAWTYYIIQILSRTCIPFCRGFTWIVLECLESWHDHHPSFFLPHFAVQEALQGPPASNLRAQSERRRGRGRLGSESVFFFVAGGWPSRFQAQQSFFWVKCQWSSWKRKRYGFIIFYPFLNQLDS